MASAIEVTVVGMGERFSRFAALALDLQDRFVFHETEGGQVRFQVTRDAVDALFAAERFVVKAPAGHLEEMCRQSGMSPELYLLVCALLGLTQWRVLMLNPLLRPQHLGHGLQYACMFSRPGTRRDLAQLLERPVLCHGCIAFYRCLGAELEVAALQRVLAYARQQGEAR